jgi:glycosyltransferase involved in cell wall biosynthesis
MEQRRLLWVDDMEFDHVHHRSRLIEMIVHLQPHYHVQLLTGYYREKVQPEAFGNRVLYYEAARTPYAKRLTRYIAQCRAFHRVFEEFRPHVVLLGCDNRALLKSAASLKSKYGVAIIYDVRTLPVDANPLRKWANGRLLASCVQYAARHLDGVTYITNEMRRYCTKEYGLPPHPTAIWTSGVNADVFSPSQSPRPSAAFTILYHGIIAKRRRIDNAVKAMALTRDLDIRLEMVGSGDGVDCLRQLADQLGLRDRVSFHGPVGYAEVPRWIGGCDVGILPLQNWATWNVSSPIKLFEYLACGKPVIVTDIPAHRDVLRSSEFAFWAPRSAPEDIATAIRQAYARRNELGRLGQGARDLVLHQYTWRHQCAKLKQFLDERIVERRREMGPVKAASKERISVVPALPDETAAGHCPSGRSSKMRKR